MICNIAFAGVLQHGWVQDPPPPPPPPPPRIVRTAPGSRVGVHCRSDVSGMAADRECMQTTWWGGCPCGRPLEALSTAGALRTGAKDRTSAASWTGARELPGHLSKQARLAAASFRLVRKFYIKSADPWFRYGSYQAMYQPEGMAIDLAIQEQIRCLSVLWCAFGWDLVPPRTSPPVCLEHAV